MDSEESDESEDIDDEVFKLTHVFIDDEIFIQISRFLFYLVTFIRKVLDTMTTYVFK